MKFKKLAVLSMLVIFLTGCAAWMPQVPQTPKDKSTFFMSFYMAQLHDYDVRYAAALEAYESDEPVSQLDQSILSAKYQFLQRAWQPIAIYDGYVASNQIPPVGLEDEINSLIGVLENYLGGL